MSENEEMGGPKGYLDTMVSMYQSNLHLTGQLRSVDVNFTQLRGYAFEFIQEHKLEDEWNEFLKEKENAVQEQKAEEVPLQEEAESGEEAVEAPKKSKKDKKE